MLTRRFFPLFASDLLVCARPEIQARAMFSRMRRANARWLPDALGPFTCNRPDKGGLAGNDVRRVIHEANGCDPSVFRIDSFDAEIPPAMLDPGSHCCRV